MGRERSVWAEPIWQSEPTGWEGKDFHSMVVEAAG